MAISGAALGALFSSATVAADGDPFVARHVLTEFSSREQVTYFAGVVEGLAYARYLADGKTTDGMSCVYDWFWKDTAILEEIHAALARRPDFPPGPLIGVLVDEACPR